MVRLFSAEARVSVFIMDCRIMTPPRVGMPYDCVLDFKAHLEDHMVLVFDVARQQECLLTCYGWEGGRKSFYHLMTVEQDPLILTCNEKTVVIETPCRNQPPKFIVELGACTGAMSVGPQFLGATTLASLDSNRLACDHLSHNSHGVVHHADLLDPNAIRDLHADVGPVPHTSMFGFPCQPYSSQGFMLYQADPRSKAFWAGLRAIFLMQAQACVLECVTGASSDSNIQQGLASLAQIMKWRIQEVTLKLEDQWPMHRCRWWCLLCPEDWPFVDLCPWPVSLEFSRILDVLPRWGVWPCHQEDELLLTQQEFQYYSNPQFGKDCRFLSSSGKASTVLHSYGNALGPCPCQCRATRFAEESLLTKGLRGFFVNSERYNQPRFLHACELAVLLTLPLSMKFEVGQRASLCLLGLVAAPLQALWLWTHLLLTASQAGLLNWTESPTSTIRRYQLEILRQIHACFPFVAEDVPASIAISSGDRPLYLLRAGSFTMSQLASAECMALDWGEQVSFCDSFGTRLRPDFKVFPGIDHGLEMIVASKKQNVEKPLGLLMIGIIHEGNHYLSCVSAGTFLFMVCYEHGLPSHLCFVDAADTFFGPDARLWKSHMFTSVPGPAPLSLVDHNSSTVPVRSSRSANGPIQDDTVPGLDDQAVWASMLAIKNQLRDGDATPLFVHPLLSARLVVGTLDSQTWRAFRTLFESSTSEIVIVFQAEGHWAALVATPDGIGLSWTYFDGLRNRLYEVARQIACKVGAGLGLINHVFRESTLIQQTDGFTCGTIAILHVCAFFGLTGSLSQLATTKLHCELLTRNCKRSVIEGKPLDLDGEEVLWTQTSFCAEGCALLVHSGLNNDTMWRALTSITRTSNSGFACPALLVPQFQMVDFYRFVLPDLKAAGWGHFRLLDGSPLHCFFERNGHWLFLRGVYCDVSKALLWTVYDGLCHLQSNRMKLEVQEMVDALADCFHHATSPISFRCVIQQAHPTTCGTVAILHLGHAVGNHVDSEPEEVWELHCDLLASQGGGSFQAFGCNVADSPQVANECLSGLKVGSFEGFGCAFDHRLGLSNHTMWYAMTSLVTPVDPSRAVMLPPFRIIDFAEQVLPDFQHKCHDGQIDGTKPIFAFVEQEGHWIFLVGLTNPALTYVEWTCFDGLDLSQQATRSKQLNDMVTCLSTCLKLPCEPVLFDRRISQQHAFVCGTVAILHLAWFLGHTLTDDPDHLLAFHRALVASQYSGDFWAFGDTDDPVPARLAAMLTAKGVPGAVVASRVSKIIQKLGKGPLLKALDAANPWVAVKALASRPGNSIQLVWKEELEAFIEAKARDKHGVAISTKKKEKSKPSQRSSPSWTLDPKLLSLLPGHFKDSEGDVVPQIDITQVTADARGIAICTASEARPYLSQSDTISTDALALLTVEEIPASERSIADASCLRFPALFVPTKDPLLIQGCLIQLGDVTINRHTPKDPTTTMDVSTTQVLKVQVFQDEFEMDWPQFVESPVRCLLKAIPLLRLCTQLSCDHKCGCFHAAVEEPLDQVIHETWGRRFQTLDGKASSPLDAVLFTAFIRVASQVTEDLLSLTVAGVYFEPRCDVSKQTDSRYSVIWVPGATREIALHKLKLLTHGLSLVRMKTRFGIRVKASLEAAAHAELRPGTDFVKVTVKVVYRVHPLPHGLQRNQVVKLLKEWGWAAKPLQPARGTSEGGAWEVGAEQPPQCSVLPAFGKDVLITLLKDRSTPSDSPSVVGPKRVQKHLQGQLPVKTPVDPWTSASEDPWARYQAPSTIPGPGAQKRLDSFAAQLKTDIVEQVSGQLSACQTVAAPVTVGPDQSTLDRMNKLEVGVAELQSQGLQFRQWFDETGSRLASQDAQLAQVHTALQQQQQDLVTVRTEVHNAADSANASLASSLTALQSQLTDQMSQQLEAQMDRFEQLMTAKKARTD